MKRILLAATIAAIGFAGCGGGDSNQALSYSEFTDETVTLCDELNIQSSELTGEAASDKPILDEYVPDLKTNIEKLQEPDPPSELVDATRTRNVAVNEIYALFEERQKAAAAGDQQTYGELVKEQQPQLQALVVAAKEASSKLGADNCF